MVDERVQGGGPAVLPAAVVVVRAHVPRHLQGDESGVRLFTTDEAVIVGFKVADVDCNPFKARLALEGDQRRQPRDPTGSRARRGPTGDSLRRAALAPPTRTGVRAVGGVGVRGRRRRGHVRGRVRRPRRDHRARHGRQPQDRRVEAARERAGVLPVRGSQVRHVQDLRGGQGDRVAAAGQPGDAQAVRVPHVRGEDGAAEVQQLRRAGIRVRRLVPAVGRRPTLLPLATIASLL